ncbi:MAG: hypothetical protein N3F08_06480 [Crenarchaeota archaeon]|nr:hypothetical protein [Thermoproteota archaeon]
MEKKGLGKKGKEGSRMLAILVEILIATSVSTLFVSKIIAEKTSEEETLPPYLGKSLSLQIQDLVQQHKEALLEIRLERKMKLIQTWEKRLSELDNEQCSIMATIGLMEQEMTRLEEKLRNGEINRGEFIMEMNRLRLEIRTRLRQLEGVEKEALKALQEEIPEINKELARKIVNSNHEFRDAKQALQEEKKAEIKAKVEEQKQDKEEKGKEKEKGKK